jgi:hypothetical protein
MASARQAELANPARVSWRQALQDRLPLFAHSNWLVVADSAYPAPCREGIETIVSNAEHIEVLQEALADVARARHLKPVVHTDQKLEPVQEKDGASSRLAG